MKFQGRATTSASQRRRSTTERLKRRSISCLLCLFAIGFVRLGSNRAKQTVVVHTDITEGTRDRRRQAHRIEPVVIKKSSGTKALNSSAQIAVIIPFLDCQIDSRLKPTMVSWAQYLPCEVVPSTAVALIFHYNKIVGEKSASSLRAIWAALPDEVTRCFSSVEIWSANLSTKEDEYPLGTCLMFHRTFLKAHLHGFSHWLQYEPDVLPIRARWLERAIFLAQDNVNCSSWWQLGSEPAYDSVTNFIRTSQGTTDVDLHINGNALYCVDSPEFTQYRAAVRDMAPPAGCAGDPNIGEFLGFDHGMYRLRHSRDSAQYLHVQHKFRLDPFIRNFGTDAFELKAVLERNPATYLVHGKYAALSEQQRLVLRISHRVHMSADEEREIIFTHWRAVGRQPSHSELAFWFKVSLLVKLNDPLLNLAELILALHLACDSKFHATKVEKYFDSKVQLAAFSAFVNIRQTLPHPSDLTSIESELARYVRFDVLSKACRISTKEACKNAERSTYAELHCPNLESNSFLRLFASTECHFEGDDGDELKVSCSGINSSLKHASDCARIHVSSEHKSTCISRFTQRSGSNSPLALGDGLMSRKHGHFIEYVTKIFPATQFLKLSSRGRDYFTSESALKLELNLLQRHITVWNTDFHAGPSAGNLAIFAALNIELDARIDFGNCVFFTNHDGKSMCANVKGLKVLANDNWSGFGLHPCPRKMRKLFYEAYRDDSDFKVASAVICSHPVANCELYMPFGKPIILYLTTRLEFGRHDKHVPWRKPWVHKEQARRAWFEWHDNFMRIASRETNAILANNEYDAQYVEYFTGIKPMVIPSWSGLKLSELWRYETYLPSRVDILLTPYRANFEYHAKDIPEDGWPNMEVASDTTNSPFSHPLFDELYELLRRSGSAMRFVTMKEAFPRGYSHISDLREFPVFLFIPYQASVMSFFELYRLNIPMLVPSEKLLLRWMQEHRLVFERVYGDPAEILMRERKLPSPNSFKLGDAKHWIGFYDIYQKETFPHLLYFDDWEHALRMLKTRDLQKISTAMSLHNTAEFHRISGLWESVFDRIGARSHDIYSYSGADRLLDFDSALWEEYRAKAGHDTEPACSDSSFMRHTPQMVVRNEKRSSHFSKCSEKQASIDLNELRSSLHAVTNTGLKTMCRSAAYDESADILTCSSNGVSSTLRSPHECSALRMLYDGQLICF